MSQYQERDGEMESKKSNYLSRYGLAFILVAVLFFTMQLFAHATDDEATTGTATVKAGKQNVNVRASAVDGASVAHVTGGDSFTVQGKVNGSDNYVWYEISGTSGGANIHGYIREDMVDVVWDEASGDTGSEDGGDQPADTPADGGGDQTPEATGTMGSILAMDPPVGEDGSVAAPNLPEGFSETRIRVGDREVQAWEKDDTFYIFYANSPSGNVGWFLYDQGEGRWVRYIDFLLESGTPAAEAKTGGGASKGVVIALIIVVVILALACAFMAYKLFAGKDYEDDDDDDDDDDYRPRRQVNTKPAAPVQGQGRPQGQSRPQGQRPAGAPVQGRPQGQRPAGTPGQVQRPSQRPVGGPRPAGAPGQRPQGQRPAGAPGQQPVRRQSQPGAPGQRQARPQGGQMARPQAGRQSRPIDDEDDE